VAVAGLAQLQILGLGNTQVRGKLAAVAGLAHLQVLGLDATEVLYIKESEQWVSPPPALPKRSRPTEGAASSSTD